MTWRREACRIVWEKPFQDHLLYSLCLSFCEVLLLQNSLYFSYLSLIALELGNYPFRLILLLYFLAATRPKRFLWWWKTILPNFPIKIISVSIGTFLSCENPSRSVYPLVSEENSLSPTMKRLQNPGHKHCTFNFWWMFATTPNSPNCFFLFPTHRLTSQVMCSQRTFPSWLQWSRKRAASPSCYLCTMNRASSS